MFFIREYQIINNQSFELLILKSSIFCAWVLVALTSSIGNIGFLETRFTGKFYPTAIWKCDLIKFIILRGQMY